MAVSKEQALELLGLNLSNEQVASSLGCHPTYITQLMADEAFAKEVTQRRMSSLQEQNKRDNEIDHIEDSLIRKLKEAVENNMIYKPADLLRAFAVVNKASRRGVQAATQPITQQTIVALNMPVKIVQKYQKTPNGEVIEVGGQTLVTMSSATLLGELGRSGDKDGRRYQEIARFLPTVNAPENKRLTDAGE